MNSARMLRYARRQAGLSQRALADRAGVPQPAIARIESGAVSPRVDTLDRLLAAVGSTMVLGRSIGDGVDRSLIEASLALSPEQRVEVAGAAGRNLAAFLTATRDGSRR